VATLDCCGAEGAAGAGIGGLISKETVGSPTSVAVPRPALANEGARPPDDIVMEADTTSLAATRKLTSTLGGGEAALIEVTVTEEATALPLFSLPSTVRSKVACRWADEKEDSERPASRSVAVITPGVCVLPVMSVASAGGELDEPRPDSSSALLAAKSFGNCTTGRETRIVVLCGSDAGRSHTWQRVSTQHDGAEERAPAVGRAAQKTSASFFTLLAGRPALPQSAERACCFGVGVCCKAAGHGVERLERRIGRSAFLNILCDAAFASPVSGGWRQRREEAQDVRVSRSARSVG
jgi:hypothetical protein